MKAKCPNCQTELRHVKSINSLLCNDCGFTLPLENEPEPAKQPNQVFKNSKYWNPSPSQFIALGASSLALIGIFSFITRSPSPSPSYELISEAPSPSESISEIPYTTEEIKALGLKRGSLTCDAVDKGAEDTQKASDYVLDNLSSREIQIQSAIAKLPKNHPTRELLQQTAVDYLLTYCADAYAQLPDRGTSETPSTSEPTSETTSTSEPTPLGLLPSIEPQKERLQELQRNRDNPFSLIPIKPTVEPSYHN